MPIELHYHHTRHVLANVSKSTNNIILCHGLTGNLNNWNTFTRIITGQDKRHNYFTSSDGQPKPQYTPFPTDVYQVDMRNHGNSSHTDKNSVWGMASDLEEFACKVRRQSQAQEGAKPSKTVIMGHSMSGVALLHSIFRRHNEKYYRVSHLPIDGELEEGGFEGISPSQNVFYGSSRCDPVVCGAIIVDITPLPKKSIERLSQIGSFIDKLMDVDLSRVHSRSDADKILHNKGIYDNSVRSYLLTNLAFDGPKKVAKWRLNLPILRSEMHRLVMPDEPVCQTSTNRVDGSHQTIKLADNVPLLAVFGERSQFYGGRKRATDEYSQYFNVDSKLFRTVELPMCDHYPHVQRPGKFAEIVLSFLQDCYK